MEGSKYGWTPWVRKQTLEPSISQKNGAKGEIERGKERRSTRVRRHGPLGPNPAEERSKHNLDGGSGGGWAEAAPGAGAATLAGGGRGANEEEMEERLDPPQPLRD
jgi:hypothetical protein